MPNSFSVSINIMPNETLEEWKNRFSSALDNVSPQKGDLLFNSTKDDLPCYLVYDGQRWIDFDYTLDFFEGAIPPVIAYPEVALGAYCDFIENNLHWIRLDDGIRQQIDSLTADTTYGLDCITGQIAHAPVAWLCKYQCKPRLSILRQEIRNKNWTHIAVEFQTYGGDKDDEITACFALYDERTNKYRKLM